LSLDDAKRVIDSIEEYFREAQVKNSRINLAGGEPLIYPYIDEIIDYISSKGIKVSMITNGSLLTEERVEKWKGKVETIGISIDAKSKETNEKIGRCTKNGTLDLTRLKGVCDKIHKLGIKLKINTVISKVNINEDLLSIYKDLKPDKIKYLCVHIIENKNSQMKSALPSKEDFDKFIETNLYNKNCQVVVENSGYMTNSYFMINPQGQVYMNDNGIEKLYGSCLETPLIKIYDSVPLYEDKFEERYERREN
jgi:radical S-adenosyl methionine domain-containing protein 2